ncbi:ATP-binding protein [Cohnella terricola]|uniref:Circadian input-output histidine kinase CikA n=1 Tax=Cohnella terricola TaxID=1289167 RepID=A0A559J6P2_9BACL|nr:ATP-binding protein [Cohnella terricola]TVX95496.1 HAMP domain-containing protein [Cohnella terricola]
MRIKTKLTVGYILLLLILAGITLFGYSQLSQMNRSMNHFYDNFYKIDAAKQLYADQLSPEQRDVIDGMDELVNMQENAMKKEMTDSRNAYDRSVQMAALLTFVGLLLGLAIVLWIFPSITRGLNLLGRMADRFGKGRLRGFAHLEIRAKDELGELGRIFKRIALDLQHKNEREAMLAAIQKRQGRMNAQLARVTELLQEGSDAKAVAQSFISEFAPELGASYGLIYLAAPAAENARLELSGTYAVLGVGEEEENPGVRKVIRPGEGLAGQCYRDAKRIKIEDVPAGYVTIGSSLGSAEAKSIIVQPIVYENAVIGVIELATVSSFNSDNEELLIALCEKLGMIVNNIRSRQRVEELLRESQAMTEELRIQSEELVCQQEELRETNDKLELQNKQIALANAELERQALQLALTTKYKSEFLANMSHELRTPLNSMLILSEFLAENREGNLTEKQQEYSRTIHSSGNDLLKMIDEILDLSKVEAGKMDIHPEWLVLDDISAFLDNLFMPHADSKQLSFVINRAGDIPESINTDGHRLKQILRNLLSNAIKFTDAGSVSLTMRRPRASELDPDKVRDGATYVALSVTDTGIGIPADKRELIFEAFRQADGTTSRKYGGTGLGLTISRELAHLLGGWILLETEVGKGSVFTLVVPSSVQDG